MSTWLPTRNSGEEAPSWEVAVMQLGAIQEAWLYERLPIAPWLRGRFRRLQRTSWAKLDSAEWRDTSFSSEFNKWMPATRWKSWNSGMGWAFDAARCWRQSQRLEPLVIEILLWQFLSFVDLLLTSRWVERHRSEAQPKLNKGERWPCFRELCLFSLTPATYSHITNLYNTERILIYLSSNNPFRSKKFNMIIYEIWLQIIIYDHR